MEAGDLSNVPAFVAHSIMKGKTKDNAKVIRKTDDFKPKKRKKRGKKRKFENSFTKEGTLPIKSVLKKKKRENDKANSKNKTRADIVLLSDNKVKGQSSSQRNENSNRDVCPLPHYDVTSDSYQIGEKMFAHLMNGSTVNSVRFFADYWEKKPTLVARKNSQYFSHLLTLEKVDKLLRNNFLTYEENLNVTVYENGVKETLQLQGRVYPNELWDYYKNGCSVRLLNPQCFCDEIHSMNAALQDYVDNFVGCNLYITPPNAQGFAPHYDDIEAFILQTEGKKLWKVYAPNANDELPRYPSKDFKGEELAKPLLEVVLNAGDTLYIPRGFIHQASTHEDCPSVHLTLSMYQKHAWIDLLERAVPNALHAAWKNDVEFRKGLPLNSLHAAGAGANKKRFKTERKLLIEKVEMLTKRALDFLDIDFAMDALGSKFMRDSLPPNLAKEEKLHTVFEDGLRVLAGSCGKLTGTVQINEDTEIRLIRRNVARLVRELVDECADSESEFRLYHTVENSKLYHQRDVQFLVIPGNLVEGAKFVINSYPKYIYVRDIPCANVDESIELVESLWERGILMTADRLLATTAERTT